MMSRQTKNSLLIFGAGHLGSSVAEFWRQCHPTAEIHLVTQSDKRHGNYNSRNLHPIREKNFDPDGYTFDHLVFCVPPGKAEEYWLLSLRALKAWNRIGSAVFTSTSGVYLEDKGEYVDEYSPTNALPKNAPTLKAEFEFVMRGGNVLRLAGLYDHERGPHIYYAKQNSSLKSGEDLINLIHYEDAANCVVASLLSDLRGQTFLAADGNPLNRQDLSRSWREAINQENGMTFKGKGKGGKILVNQMTRIMLGWSPKYNSFRDWCRDEANRHISRKTS